MTTAFVPILSGGLDSTTMMMFSIHQLGIGHDEVHAVGFNYGQRHVKELKAAKALCKKLEIKYTVIDLQKITPHLAVSGSALINPDTVMPEGHYAQDNMSQTVVPNRNMIMIAIAGGVATAEKATTIGIGVHAGDHAIYPDCRPAFIAVMDRALVHANKPHELDLYAPFVYSSKNEIAKWAFELQDETGVEFIKDTWSCYKGEDIHCGRCGTCVERLEAISSTGREDPTEYADNKYWKTVTNV